MERPFGRRRLEVDEVKLPSRVERQPGTCHTRIVVGRGMPGASRSARFGPDFRPSGQAEVRARRPQTTCGSARQSSDRPQGRYPAVRSRAPARPGLARPGSSYLHVILAAFRIATKPNPRMLECLSERRRAPARAPSVFPRGYWAPAILPQPERIDGRRGADVTADYGGLAEALDHGFGSGLSRQLARRSLTRAQPRASFRNRPQALGNSVSSLGDVLVSLPCKMGLLAGSEAERLGAVPPLDQVG